MKRRKADGSAGARRASAILGIAACAQSTDATLDEEAAKVDMKFTFRHAFQPEKLVTFHAQVKTGHSYRASSSDDKTLKLNIDRETLSALSGTSTPGLVVWVPPPPLDRLYWYAQDPRRPFRTIANIERNQYVRPSLRYDLTRLSIYASWSKSVGMQTVAARDPSSYMHAAKQAYAALKARQWRHPLVGDLQVTRLAWRHVTRRSRTKLARNIRLVIAPYLKNFLEKAPDRYICNQASIEVKGRRTFDTRFVLCWYRNALQIGQVRHALLLRIKEVVSYPTTWASHPLGVPDIEQKATLESWWCKPEKDVPASGFRTDTRTGRANSPAFASSSRNK